MGVEFRPTLAHMEMSWEAFLDPTYSTDWIPTLNLAPFYILSTGDRTLMP